ncbi:MAG: DUF1861 family protein [Gemmatimonadetes bacterium]|jgi:hypothetical protein|nr:DUF1861 family protein [Gemmatimonadota bacterium]MBT7859036.1 DUF1861 family protein [Gemmatimonadota bacterium]
MRDRDGAISARQLLADFRTQERVSQGELIQFDGVGERDVYNVTAPFSMDGMILIAGRVEPRDTELAETMLFVEGTDGIWRPHAGAPSYPKLQDPCVSFIGDELVLGGVEFPVSLPGRDAPGWRMAFYRGESLESLRLFLHGPDHMKDIRLGPLPDGRIAVCSRPQGARGGRGQIGFTTVDSLDDLTAESIEAAPLLTGQFLTEEWGGANELHLLKDGRLGILGHIAWMRGEGEDEEKHYYPMAFTLDPDSGDFSPLQIIASRDDFPVAAPKRPGLRDVIFSGGLDRDDVGAWLYAGLSDSAAGRVRVADPFANV